MGVKLEVRIARHAGFVRNAPALFRRTIGLDDTARIDPDARCKGPGSFVGDTPGLHARPEQHVAAFLAHRFTTPLTRFTFTRGQLSAPDSFQPRITLAVTGAGTITIRESPVPLVGAMPVPEPSTLALAASGALGLIGYAIRRRRRA